MYISSDDPTSGGRAQYFNGVPPDVWASCIGGCKVCEKWLKNRVGQHLSYSDITHYQRVVVALHESIRLMAEIDSAINTHGGRPIK